MKTVKNLTLGAMLFSLVVTVVWAASTYADFLHALGARESSLVPGALNRAGYAGLFQMGEGALIDAGYYRGDGTAANDWRGSFTGKNGVTSLSSFLNNPDAQIKAIVDYEAAQWRVIQSLGLANFIGQSINGVPITQSGLIAGAHLVGYGGLRDYLRSNGSRNVVDGNGTHISEYISRFGGYAIGGPAPSFVNVMAAQGNPGQPAPVGGGGNPVPVPGSPAVPAPPGASNFSPDQAFFQNTGYQYFDVSDAIRLALGATLFLWTAWTAAHTWNRFHHGRANLMTLKTDIFRALILLTVGIVLLT